MQPISAVELYNLPLHEYTLPVVHFTSSSSAIPTALALPSDNSDLHGQLEQIRDFVNDYFDSSCFKAGIVLCNGSGDASALTSLRDAMVDDPLLSKFQRVLCLTGGFQAFEQEFPGLCEAYAAYTLSNQEDMFVFPARVRPHLYLGSASSARLAVLSSLNIGAVVNTGAYHARLDDSFPASDYLYLDFLDSTDVVLAPFLEQTNEFIAAAVAGGKSVFVHCEQGRSRSASVAIAYLMHSEGLSFDDAIDQVRAARQVAQPNVSFVQQLRVWCP